MDELDEPAEVRTTTIAIDPDERPTEVVVRAVATLEGKDPTALAPLYWFVDPDALDAVFAGRDPASAGALQVTFAFSGYRVTVTDDSVVVKELDADQ